MAERVLGLSQRHFEGESERLELGLSDAFRVTQVEEELAQADLAMAVARFQVELAVSGLRFAMGESARRYL